MKSNTVCPARLFSVLAKTFELLQVYERGKALLQKAIIGRNQVEWIPTWMHPIFNWAFHEALRQNILVKVLNSQFATANIDILFLMHCLPMFTHIQRTLNWEFVLLKQRKGT